MPQLPSSSNVASRSAKPPSGLGGGLDGILNKQNINLKRVQVSGLSQLFGQEQQKASPKLSQYLSDLGGPSQRSVLYSL